MKKLSNLDFIEKCNSLHNYKYDYSKTKYVNTRTKIVVICPQHGEFEITPDRHSGKQKQGCADCALDKHKLTSLSDDRILKMSEIHNNKYLYNDLSVTDGMINITCPTHGVFCKNIYHHEGGTGCPECNDSVLVSKVDESITITHKVCNKCNKDLNVSNFYKEKRNKDGFRHICKQCNGDIKSKPEGSKICQDCNQEKDVSEFSLRNSRCKECQNTYSTNQKRLNSKNREMVYNIPESKVCSKCNIDRNIDDFAERVDSKDNHRNICKECYSPIKSNINKLYKQKNKEEILRKDIIYRKNRMASDPLFRAKIDARNVIRKAISKGGWTKKARTYEILGCSYEEFKEHIESLFVDGMSWENRDMWHIDHVIPLSFAENEEECLMLNNYINLRPLWIEDNQEKSDTIVVETDLYKRILMLRMPIHHS